MIKVYQYKINENIHYIDFIKSDKREKEILHLLLKKYDLLPYLEHIASLEDYTFFEFYNYNTKVRLRVYVDKNNHFFKLNLIDAIDFCILFEIKAEIMKKLETDLQDKIFDTMVQAFLVGKEKYND